MGNVGSLWVPKGTGITGGSGPCSPAAHARTTVSQAAWYLLNLTRGGCSRDTTVGERLGMLCQECVEADEEISLSSPFEGLIPSRGPSKKLCQYMPCSQNPPCPERALYGCRHNMHPSGIAGLLG